jgi:hypothetical protein
MDTVFGELPRPTWWGALSRAGREVAIVAALFLLYNAGRVAVHGQESVARHHARWVHHLEGALRLPSEAWVQSMAEKAPRLMELANFYYTSVHFPLALIFVAVGFVFHPTAEYIWARNLMIVQTFLALAIHISFPLAPPRMFPQWGFTDTGASLGMSPYEGKSGAVANQFAAMPSLHIGWAVLIAVVVSRTAPRWLETIAWLHATATVIVVVITANHWWLDGIVAVALLGVALIFFPAPGRTRLPVPARPSPSRVAPRSPYSPTSGGRRP